MVASFVLGLRENSRLMMKLNGMKVTSEVLLLSQIVDRLSILVWQNTEDGAKGKNKPEMISPKLFGFTDEESHSYSTFISGEEFEKAREIMLKRIGGES